MTDPCGIGGICKMAGMPKGASMAYGRSRFYDHGNVALKGEGLVRPDSPTSNTSRRHDDMAREIDTLRSINANLARQIAHLKQREAQALRLADRDGLTGLYNRRRMMELLDTAISDAARLEHRLGLLFIDLDGFKGVNDAHGHAAGDQLLITVASRIAARARSADVVCRYGGDEFVVILPRVADLTAVCRVAASIRSRVALPYRIDGVELTLTAAIGISLYPDQARNAADLLNQADTSMYRAKAGAANPDKRHHGVTSPARRRDDVVKRHSW